MNPYDVLGLEPGTTDPVAIRRAYAEKLRQHRPDVDPAGFARIREAKDWLLDARPVEFTAEDDTTLDEPRGETRDPPPDRERARPADPSYEINAELTEVLARGTMAHKAAVARRIATTPIVFADVRDPRRVIELAESIAFAYPNLAGSLVSAWWETADVRDRARISLAELDRRRAIAGLAASCSQPGRRLVFALATGTPSTSPYLANDVPAFEKDLSRRPESDSLVVWLLKSVPNDPVSERLKHVYQQRHKVAMRERAPAAPKRDDGGKTAARVVFFLIALAAVVSARGCNSRGVTTPGSVPWTRPPPRYVPYVPPPPKFDDGDQSIEKSLDEYLRRLKANPPR